MGFLLIAFLASCFSLFHSVHGAGPATEGETVRCTAGTFAVGDSGQIQCQFPIDVNTSRHSFNIMHYRNETETTGNYIILCNWVASSTQCSINEGYALSLNFGKLLTVEIPIVKDSMSGMYLCQLVPSDDVSAEKCRLTLTERGITSVPLSTTSPKAASDQQAVSDTQKPSSGECSAGIVGGFLAIFVAFSIGLCLFIVYLRCRYILKDRTEANVEADAWNDFPCVKLKCFTVTDQNPTPSAGSTTEAMNTVPKDPSEDVNSKLLLTGNDDETTEAESDQEQPFVDAPAHLPTSQQGEESTKDLNPIKKLPAKKDRSVVKLKNIGSTSGGSDEGHSNAKTDGDAYNMMALGTNC